jgi:arginine decarboxylase-like protein
MLAVNRWNDTYERVWRMTCDSDDYYNSEQNMFICQKKEKPLYIGFFNTGAYQETIGGWFYTPLFNSTTQTHINRQRRKRNLGN